MMYNISLYSIVILNFREETKINYKKVIRRENIAPPVHQVNSVRININNCVDYVKEVSIYNCFLRSETHI